jgi:membrane protein
VIVGMERHSEGLTIGLPSRPHPLSRTAGYSNLNRIKWGVMRGLPANSSRSSYSRGSKRFLGLDVLVRPKTIIGLLKLTLWEWNNDEATRMGAALAYYSIFSLAPLLVIAIAISGLALGVQAAQGQITGEIQGLIGVDGARAIQTMIQSVHKPGNSLIALVVGMFALFFGASRMFSEMRDDLNTIWHVDPGATFGVWNFLRTRFLGCGMVLGIGFLLLISLLLSALVTALATYVGGLLPVPPLVLEVIDCLFSFACVTCLFAMIFKMLPNVAIAWSDVCVGAVLTSLLFTVGKLLIGFYIGKSALASAYGATGSLVIVVAWIYYSALILYFGAEFTHVYATKMGSQQKS